MEMEALKAKIDELLGDDVEGKAGLAVVEVLKAVLGERDQALQEKEAAVAAHASLTDTLAKIASAMGLSTEGDDAVSPEDVIAAVEAFVDKAGRKLSAKTMEALRGVSSSIKDAQGKLEDLIAAESKKDDDDDGDDKGTQAPEAKVEGAPAGDEEGAGDGDGEGGSKEETSVDIKGLKDDLEDLKVLRSVAEQILGDSQGAPA